jgi:hypothetical protein
MLVFPKMSMKIRPRRRAQGGKKQSDVKKVTLSQITK